MIVFASEADAFCSVNTSNRPNGATGWSSFFTSSIAIRTFSARPIRSKAFGLPSAVMVTAPIRAASICEYSWLSSVAICTLSTFLSS